MSGSSLEKLADPTQWHVMPVSKSDAALMPPPAPRPGKRRQRVVLSEEDYTDAVGKIIERDFFPDLPKLQQQLQLLEATKSGDARIVREVTRRILSEQRRFGQTPTPGMQVPASPMHSEIGESEQEHQEEREQNSDVNTNVRLDTFMARYTSEDNASFEEIHASDQVAFRTKRSWACDQPGQEAGKQMLYFLPDGTAISKEEREKFDKLLELEPMIGDDLPAAPETWTYRTRNALMFQPDMESAKDASQISKQGKVDIERPLALPSNREDQKLLTNGSDNRYVNEVRHAEKSINYKNTRFRAGFLREQSQKTGITPSPLEAPHTPSLMSEPADETSAPSNYKYVAMTPSPMPGAAGDSPLVTWGDISGTPLILDPSELGIDTSGAANAFTIQDIPFREKVANHLEAKQRQHGQSLKAAGRTPLRRSTGSMTPSPSPLRAAKKRNFGELTPAAQALARRMSAGKSSAESELAGLRKSYASTPSRTPSHMPSQARNQRPRTTTTTTQQSTTSSSLTDGLLEL